MKDLKTLHYFLVMVPNTLLILNMNDKKVVQISFYESSTLLFITIIVTSKRLYCKSILRDLKKNSFRNVTCVLSKLEIFYGWYIGFTVSVGRHSLSRLFEKRKSFFRQKWKYNCCCCRTIVYRGTVTSEDSLVSDLYSTNVKECMLSKIFILES